MRRNNKRGPWYARALSVFGIALVFFIIALLVFIFYPWKEKPHKPPALPPEIARIEKPPPLPARPHIAKPRVAIVIDDMGQDMRALRDLLEIDAPISFAVLPFLPHSKEVAKEASSKGRVVLLHLPMEPRELANNDPGKGALYTDMPETLVAEQVRRDIEAVPYITGINNHMGSLFTEDERLMKVVLEIAKTKNLFFLDSKTTNKSVAYKLAKAMGLKAATRQVFLDNEENEDYVKKQIAELIKIAKKRGSAIAIGHPHQATIAALKEMLPILDNDVEITAVSSLIDSTKE
ncbi:MAG: divergent polysaccharide deacetylase family protein [Deltaproteobacteria bacterium]|nr:divergent polysaccharide deacetylase family protein [Deltaproteobacteria bacterium]